MEDRQRLMDTIERFTPTYKAVIKNQGQVSVEHALSNNCAAGEARVGRWAFFVSRCRAARLSAVTCELKSSLRVRFKPQDATDDGGDHYMTMDYQRKITNIVALALDMFVPSL
jgi:hypothetical protein